MVTMEIPDSLTVEAILAERLPGNWREYPAPAEVTAVGDAWLTSVATAVATVPSVLVPALNNYLLNPAHPEFRRCRITDIEPFAFDRRLFPLGS